MTKFKIDKLVRDKVAQEPNSKGVRHLLPAEHIEALKLKLIEEAYEVSETTSFQDLVEEIADVQEILETLIKMTGLSPQEIAQRQKDKKNRKGGFEGGFYVNHVEVDPGSTLEKELLKAGNKYPQIKS